MSTDRRWPDFLADLPQLILAVAVGVLLWQTFAGRVLYPYDLEWMEGGMLLHGLRVMEGQGLYVEPTASFIPYIYPPLYSWLLGGLGEIFGLDYALGRSISMVGTLVAAAGLVAAIAGERLGVLLGIGAAGLFLTGYDESGSFYDLVRADGVLIGLVAWALVAARHGWLRTSGLLLTGAYLAKHSVAILGLSILYWLWKNTDRAAATRFVAWSVGPALLVTGAVQLSGDGLFLTYLLGVPSRHPFVLGRFIPGAEREIFMTLPLTLGLAGLTAAAWLARTRFPSLNRPPRPIGSGLSYWLIQGGMLVLLSAVMRGHHGGYVNVLIPGIWAAALWSALAVGRVRAEWPLLTVRIATSLLIAGQLWVGRWDPAPLTPTAEDVAAGDALIEEIAEVDGEVLAPQFPWYPVMAGKTPYFHLIALWDINHTGGPLEHGVAHIEQAMSDKHWAAIFTANSKLEHGFKKNYRRQSTIQSGTAMQPVTGWRVRPRYRYIPRTDRAPWRE
ncbi:MAG: hypothetical protein P8R54_04735 [Myxococcota bacterium]|nr:hypothetical protein [Myxococcota bacterium]